MTTKEFGAKIPTPLYEEFRELFPMYGATTWFINSALREFVEVIREDHELQKHVEVCIQEMLKGEGVEE